MIKKVYKKLFSERFRIRCRLAREKLLSIFYIGKKYRCNCCNKSFRKFKSKGNWEVRKNAQCPYCGSLERTRLLLFYLQNETTIFKNETSLLHFAPEFCLVPLLKKSDNLNYISGDINPNYADYQMDIMDIPYPDNSFDYIICSHVLGHVPDEGKAVREMSRVLKPSGKAFILTILDRKNPITHESKETDTPAKRLKEYSEPDLLRLHGLDFEKRLSDNGFDVSIIDYATSFENDVRERYSLGNKDRELIFKCTKKI